MRTPALALALACLCSPAHAADVPRDGDLLRPDTPADWVLEAGVHLPPGLRIGADVVARLVLHPAGLIGRAAIEPERPRALAEVPQQALIAALWSPLHIGPCPDGRPGGEVRRAVLPDGLWIGWHDVPLRGCPADAESATFGVRLTWDDAARLRHVELRYGALPVAMIPEPRAGVVVQQALGEATVLELLPDAAEGPLQGRAKALLEGSSDGETGVWVIELDADGRVVGDEDLDGVRSADNCRFVFNPMQENLDGDPHGDACDTNTDGDAFRDDQDNCPRVWQGDQADLDGDGLGDACDADVDGDGWIAPFDRCPRAFDLGDRDLDRDGIGDACDPDADADDPWTILFATTGRPDRCPLVFDPWRVDTDRDRLGDACDLLPEVPCDADCAAQADRDGDGIGDRVDLCPTVSGDRQVDRDGDGRGDACDPDADGDGVLDVYQLCDAGGCSDPVRAGSLRVPLDRRAR